MKQITDVLDREDIFFLKNDKDLTIFYTNLEKILVDLKLDTAFEYKPSKQKPTKKKVGPTILVKHKFDTYTTAEITLKFKIDNPKPFETKNPDIFKVIISYKAELITDPEPASSLQPPHKFRRSELFKKYFPSVIKKVYEKPALDEYKDYTEKIMFKIINKARELYQSPETLKKIKAQRH